MARNYQQPGHHITIIDTSRIGVKSGDLVQIGELYAVALNDVDANGLGTFSITGVWQLKGITAGAIGTAVAQGIIWGNVIGSGDTALTPVLLNGLPGEAAM